MRKASNTEIYIEFAENSYEISELLRATEQDQTVERGATTRDQGERL